MEKHRNENSDKIKQIKLIMIFGHALIIIIAAIFMACFTIKKNDMVLKSKVSDLTYALNFQMKLNINTYLSKLESVSTLVFGTEEAPRRIIVIQSDIASIFMSVTVPV